MSDVLRVERREGAIAVVTLSRPDRLNAIGTDTLAALDAALVDARVRRPRRARS